MTSWAKDIAKVWIKHYKRNGESLSDMYIKYMMWASDHGFNCVNRNTFKAFIGFSTPEEGSE